LLDKNYLRRHLASLWNNKRTNGLHLFRNYKADEDDDPRKVNIIETEGQGDVEGPTTDLPFIGQPIKIKKFNIGTEETPNLEHQCR
jgi:hypothetical protein